MASEPAATNSNAQSTRLIACIECDLVVQAQRPQGGQRLVCPRCDHIMARGTSNALERTLALSTAALISLVCALSFPFLSFELGGQVNTIDLSNVAETLYDVGFGTLGITAFAFMVFAPLVYLCALIALLLRAQHRQFDTVSRRLARTISVVYRWTMADVFIVGVMVALVKISETADISLGVSFWFYIAFTVLFLRISLIVDTDNLWRWASNEH